MSEIDYTNKNNHAGIQRRTENEKAEALLGLVNERRLYVNRFSQLPTWDELEWLAKLQREVEWRYQKEVNDAETLRIREEYLLLTNKKPFLWWSNEEIIKRMEEFKANQDTENTPNGLNYKKVQWKKAMKK